MNLLESECRRLTEEKNVLIKELNKKDDTVNMLTGNKYIFILFLCFNLMFR